MGLTHYWQREEELPKEEFRKIAEDIKRLFDVIEIPLGDKTGQGNPVVSDEEISFSGITGQSCEPFCIKRLQLPRRSDSIVFEYCKTEYMPYDFVVKCTLIILSHHLKDLIKVSSDEDDNAWGDARDFCEKHLEYGANFILIKEKE